MDHKKILGIVLDALSRNINISDPLPTEFTESEEKYILEKTDSFTPDKEVYIVSSDKDKKQVIVIGWQIQG